MDFLGRFVAVWKLEGFMENCKEALEKSRNLMFQKEKF
jgi:hypothetical protein